MKNGNDKEARTTMTITNKTLQTVLKKAATTLNQNTSDLQELSRMAQKVEALLKTDQ